MFDVVSSKVAGDYIYFYCINDKKEESVNAALNTHIQNNFTGNASSQKKTADFLKNFIKQCIAHQEIIHSGFNEGENNFNLREFYTLHITYDITPPPPKFI
jgi:hypothetical protein